MVEFSSVSMPITAPGADQVLKVLGQLDARGQAAASAIGGNAAAHQAAAVAGDKHHLAIGRINMALEALAVEALGANSKIGTLSAKFLEFGVGGAVTGGVLAGLAAMAIAWDKVAESSRKAKEKFDEAVKTIEDFRKKQLQGPGGEIGASAIAIRDQLPLERLALKLMQDERKALGRNADSPRALMLDLQIKEQEAAIKRYEIAARVADEEVTRATGEETDKRKAKADEEWAKWQSMMRQKIDGMKATEDELTRISAAGVEARARNEDLSKLGLGLANTASRGTASAPAIPASLIASVTAAKFTQTVSLKQAKEFATEMVDIAGNMASSITQVISNTLSAGLSGGITSAFAALTKGLIKSMGEMFLQIGEKGLAGAILLKLMRDGFSLANPSMSIQAALGLITLGSAMVAVGNAGGGSRGGGAGSSYSSPAGAAYGAQLVSVGPSAGPNMSGVRAISPVIVQATFIGKHDAKAARELSEMIDYHQRRRS